MPSSSLRAGRMMLILGSFLGGATVECSDFLLSNIMSNTDIMKKVDMNQMVSTNVEYMTFILCFNRNPPYYTILVGKK